MLFKTYWFFFTRRVDGSREKVFEHRESLLTELFKISHIRTLRHIFISILIIICIQILVFDYTTYGKLNLDFELFTWSFKGFLVETMLCTWLPMKLSALVLVYYSFKFWATSRESIKSSKFIFNISYWIRMNLIQTFTINRTLRWLIHGFISYILIIINCFTVIFSCQSKCSLPIHYSNWTS